MKSVPLVLIAVVFAAGCGSDVGDAPESNKVNEINGTYAGVGIGDSARTVRASFGDSPPLRSEPVTPLGRDLNDIDTHNSPGCPAGFGPVDFFRYQWIAFALQDHRVCDVLVIEDGAATLEGIAVGDSIEEVPDAYPKFECGDAYAGEGLFGSEATVPYCSGKLADERYLWFGGDPINVIQMNTKPLKG